MRRSNLLVPFLVLVLCALAARSAHAQLSPGMSGGNALAPATAPEGSMAPTRATTPRRVPSISALRVTHTPMASRLIAAPHARITFARLRWLVPFVR
jgi:hypothetical protein